MPQSDSRNLRARVARRLAVLSGLGLACASPAAPDLVLDQAYEGFANSRANVGPPDRAQTFTVGVAGLLAEIDLKLHKRDAAVTSDLLFDVRPTVAGVPVEEESAALASIALPAHWVSTTPTWISFDLRSFDIDVEVDDVLAIVLRDPDGDGVGGGRYRWRALGFLDGQENQAYPAGQVFCRLGILCEPVTWLAQPELDANFRTFVALPEPGDLARSAAGLLTLAGLARRRRGRRRAPRSRRAALRAGAAWPGGRRCPPRSPRSAG